jgi:hypothetical protein
MGEHAADAEPIAATLAAAAAKAWALAAKASKAPGGPQAAMIFVMSQMHVLFFLVR